MKVGDSAEITRTFTAQDLQDYAKLCGHKTSAGRESIPGPLIGALFSYLLGVKLPGMGTMYLKQKTSYQAGAVIGEPLTARAEITRLRPDKQLADLATTCRCSDGKVVAYGRALVYIGDLMHKSDDD